MSRERIVSGGVLTPDEDLVQFSLRPKALREYIGQKELKTKLEILISAAKGRKEPVEHILLYGPPGLGKTTLAHIIANEMGSKIISTSGPALQRELTKVVQASERGHNRSLKILAGHGLTYRNVRLISSIPEIEELNIGHNIIARASLVGLDRAVREMLQAMND